MKEIGDKAFAVSFIFCFFDFISLFFLLIEIELGEKIIAVRKDEG